MQTVGAPKCPMTSLYVGDLHLDVTEAMLVRKFSPIGPVLSAHVCRDKRTQHSLGYAYVNFQKTVDAERAMETMNFDFMKGRPIRITWSLSQRYPTARKPGLGNIFIKNFDKDMDDKDMYDSFCTFGTILSCKVATDDDGKSKGHGFVQFETDEAANKAVEKLNGISLSDKKLYVGKFVPVKEREKQLEQKIQTNRFTNVYLKNFPDSVDDKKLKDMFESHGIITSCKVISDAGGKSKCFEFVAFKNPWSD